MKRAFAACAVVAAALLLAACGGSSKPGKSSTSSSSSSKSSSKAPIQVLSIVDMSGPTKIYGSLHWAGLQAAANYLNANGGVNGRKIEITRVDFGGVTATGVSDAIRDVGGSPGKYAFVDAGDEGTIDDALIPIMAKYHQFALTLDDSGVCADGSKCPYEFVVKGKPSDPAIAAASYFKKKGLKKVGILQEAIAFTEGETPGMEAALRADGITPTVVSFPATATSVTPELSQLKSEGVQGVFAEALGPPAGYTLEGRASLSWSVPVMFDVAASSLDITKLAPKSDLSNAYLNIYRCQDGALPTLPGMVQMEKYMPASFKAIASAQACDIPGNGWDEMIEFANAAKQAPSLSTSALTSAMENLSSSAQNDPLYITSKSKRYTASDHEDVAESPSDFVVVGVGPVSGEQDHPLGG